MLVWVGGAQSMMPWVAAGLLIAITFGEGGVYEALRVLLRCVLTGIGRDQRESSANQGASHSRDLLDRVRSDQAAAVPLSDAAPSAPDRGSGVQSGRRAADQHLHPRPVLGPLRRRPSVDRRRRVGLLRIGQLYRARSVVSLAALGMWSWPRRSLPWVLCAAFFFTMAIGGPSPWYPWALLHHLPLMSSERVPSRTLMAFTLPAGVLAGFGADVLARSWKPLGAILGSALLAAAILDAWMVNRPNLDPLAEADPPVAFGEALGGGRLSDLPPGTSWSPQFRQFYGSPWEMVGTAISNLGSVFCNEGMDFSDLDKMNVVGFNQPGYRGEQFLLRPGSVTLRRWTPNALSYDVNTPAANVMVVNQNYDPNWRLAEGDGEVFSEGGLIGVRLRAGAHHLEVAYRSYPFLAVPR